MATSFQKAVKGAIVDSDLYPDHIVCKKDGTVHVKRSYFYSGGATATKFADKVAKIVTDAGIDCGHDGLDNYAQWPTTSYWTAIISPKDSVR